MIEELVLATKNEGKIREFKSLLGDEFKHIISLRELDSIPDIIEDGKTYLENALKKARVICNLVNKATLADDSGLEVEILGNRPGIFSSRYAGESASDRENIEKLLSKINGNSNRRGRFVCNLALVLPDCKEVIAEGICSGIILTESRGESGFGYDPVFFLPEMNKTMAELSLEEKNKISHRALAVKKLISNLNT